MTKKPWSIRIINQFANTPDLPGHTRQFELAEGLTKKGWRVIVYSSDFSLSKRRFMRLKKYELAKSEKTIGITWKWLRVTPYKNNNLFRYINILSFAIHISVKLIIDLTIEKFQGKNSVVICSSPQLPAAFICRLITMIFKSPFVFEVRDLWPQILVDQGGMSENSIIVRSLKFMELFLYRSSHHIIVLSEGVINYVKNRGALSVSHIPNGPDINKFTYSPISPNRSSFRVLYAGAHGAANNLKNVVECAKILQQRSLNSIQFIMVGDGPEKHSLIHQASGLKNISFLDAVSKDKVASLFASSDAILISLADVPLFKYGVSPNKLYDAYASGRPVISTVPGIINQEIESYQLGVTCSANNPNSLADAVELLMRKSDKERISMGLRARDLACSKYSRTKAIEYLDSIVHNLIK